MKKANKEVIETNFYKKIKLIIESQYNVEGVINPSRKSSTKIIFKDRNKLISMVKDAILEYAQEKNLDVREVTECLMENIDLEMKITPLFEEEYKEVKDIVSIKDDDER